MSTDITPITAVPINAPLARPNAFAQDFGDQAAGAQSSPFAAIRRQWPLVLTLWVLIAGIAVPYAWMFVKPTYTATAQVQIVPNLSPILFPGVESDTVPFFDAFLNTEVQRIVSRAVLKAALEDPGVKALPNYDDIHSVSLLRKSIKVENLRKTHLLEIQVTQSDEATAVALAQAVLNAYLSTAVQGEDSMLKEKRRILQTEREKWAEELEQQQAAIDRLAQDYETPDAAMLNAIRERLLQTTLDTHTALEDAEREIMELQLQLEQIEKGNLPTVIGKEEPRDRQMQLIENDPRVIALRNRLQEVSQKLERFLQGLTEDNPHVIAAREEKKRLENELLAQREQVVRELFKGTSDDDGDVHQFTKAQLEMQLELTKQRRDLYKKRVEQQDKEDKAIGIKARSLALLQEKKDDTKLKFDHVNERIRQLNIESQRHARVRDFTEAEVLPTGVRDKRMKFSLAGIMGGLMLGLLAALIKDRMDPHLHGPGQVETGMGLRLLGAVPCLTELKAGRVTQEDFIESYRVVRATLSSLGEGGLPPRSLLITSAQAGDGKTSLAVSLAASLAETGARVLLIDGDLQAPSIANFFHMDHRPGLNAVLKQETTVAEAITSSPLEGVDVLVAGLNGSPNARGILDPRSADRVMQAAQETYDHIVIDSPPALGAADSLVWSRVVDGVVMSSLAGRSDVAAMRLACQRLQTVGAKLLGAVVGNVSINEAYYSSSVNKSHTHVRSAWNDAYVRGGKSPEAALPFAPVEQVEDPKSNTDAT